MTVYSNKPFVKKQAELANQRKKKQFHAELWDQICEQVSEFERKEQIKQKLKDAEEQQDV